MYLDFAWEVIRINTAWLVVFFLACAFFLEV
jgi:hypothetical protein